MLSNEGKRRLATIVFFGLPIVLVKMTGMMFVAEGVDASTIAAPVANPIIAAPAAGAIVPDDQRAATEHALRLRQTPFGSAPLYFDRRQGPVKTADPKTPQFVISAIMAASTGNIASIDGRFYRVDDVLPDTSWKIVDIDPVKRSVTIEDERTGEHAVRYVRTP